MGWRSGVCAKNAGMESRMTLPADISRCQGIAPDSLPCPVRHECERYLALMDRVRSDVRVPVSRILCVTADGRPDDTFPHFIAADK